MFPCSRESEGNPCHPCQELHGAGVYGSSCGVSYWQSSFAETPWIFWQWRVFKGILKVMRTGNAALGPKAEQKPKRTIKMFEAALIPSIVSGEIKSKPWIQGQKYQGREGLAFSNFLKEWKTQNVGFRPANNSTKLTTVWHCLQICHQMLWKSGLSSLNVGGSSMEFCLSIWIWQLNKPSSVSSLSLMVLIRNFSFELGKCSTFNESTCPEGEKKGIFRFPQKILPFSCWVKEPGSIQSGIFQNVVFQNKATPFHTCYTCYKSVWPVFPWEKPA